MGLPVAASQIQTSFPCHVPLAMGAENALIAENQQTSAIRSEANSAMFFEQEAMDWLRNPLAQMNSRHGESGTTG